MTKVWESIPPKGPLLRPKWAATYLGISRSSYYRMAAEGRVPPSIRIGEGFSAAVGVPLPWLEACVSEAAL